MSSLSLEKKLKLIKRPLKEWNRSVFGHIERNICKFMQALKCGGGSTKKSAKGG